MDMRALVNLHLRSGQLGSVRFIQGTPADEVHERCDLASSLPLSASSLASRRGIVQWSKSRRVRRNLDVLISGMTSVRKFRLSTCNRLLQTITL